MKSAWMWFLISLLSVGSAAWAQDKKAGGGTEKAVAALEQQWLQSQKTKNLDLVAPLLTDKFINTGSDGKFSGMAKSLATSKATKCDNNSYENVKVNTICCPAIA